MWHLYVIISLLAAGTVLKIVAPLLNRGRMRQPGATVTRADRRLAAFLTCAVPLLALSIYLLTGHPDLPGKPALLVDPLGLAARQDALLEKRPTEILLHENPDDIGSTVKLADIGRRLGRYREAAKLMQRVVILAQQQDDIFLRIYAENLGRLEVLANGGQVGKDAIGTFNYVLTLKKEDPIAHYYLALAKAQNGDPDTAIEEWNDLLSEGATGAYWKEYVRQAIAVTKAGKLGQQPINIP
jgi:cytochrome c-type biogenesis protein CcmH